MSEEEVKIEILKYLELNEISNIYGDEVKMILRGNFTLWNAFTKEKVINELSFNL